MWRGEENQGPGLMVFFFHINDIETTMTITICCYLYNSKRRGNKWPVCQFIRGSSDAQMPAQHCWHSFNKILAGKSSGSIFHPIEDMFLFVASLAAHFVRPRLAGMLVKCQHCLAKDLRFPPVSTRQKRFRYVLLLKDREAGIVGWIVGGRLNTIRTNRAISFQPRL